GRVFYGIGIAGLGVQQFIYKEFRPVIIPQWSASVAGVTVWAYITGALLIIAGAIIVFSKSARIISIDLGIAFFLLFLAFHVTNILFNNTNGFHFYLFTDPLKELTLSGGALVVAGSYPAQHLNTKIESFKRTQYTLTRTGSIFLSITMIVFGIDHFLYTDFVVGLVPAWLPWHIFWTYFAAVALIGSGVCIILKIKLKLVAFLLGLMLLIWFIILHIPRAIADPYGMKGNEISSVFEALAFSGIAFLISCKPGRETLGSSLKQ
ncbi:MAG: hypothetical protein ACRDE8_17395, partial [Ginsengibacter sp.]